MDKQKRYCNECCCDVQTIEKKLESGPHYSSHTCVVCGKHLGFGKKPGNESKRAKNKYSPADIGIDFCQLCLRPIDRLGKRGVLEVHHVSEIQSGGKDAPENIWVICTSCHKLIHHQRTYLNQHLQDTYTIGKLRSEFEKYKIPAETQSVITRIFENWEANNAGRRS